MSGFLLDINVLSEVTRQTPDANVLAFLDRAVETYLSSITIHELQYGISRLPAGLRRALLEAAVGELLSGYADVIIPVDRAEAKRAGELRALREASGTSLHLADSLIAATALEHQLTLATHNVADFHGLGLKIVDPWKGT